MPTYMTWYSDGEYGKLWFDADNPEQAEELLQKVLDGEMLMESLPRYEKSIKGGEPLGFEPVEECK